MRGTAIIVLFTGSKVGVIMAERQSIAYPHPGNTCNVLMVGGNMMSIPRGKIPTDGDQSFWRPTQKKNTWW